MKWFFLVSLLAVAALAQELPPATECDEETCRLPECRCSTINIPGGLAPRDTPQFVSLTFDDAVNIVNIETYRNILYNRRNSNGCPIGATFYVNHEYTNYQLVNELYNRGLEIALHSISHRTPQTWWGRATYEEIRQEIGDQKAQMAHFANIPESEIRGVRLPFLQMAGNNSFQVMREYNILYDHSWPTMRHIAPGLWPYTLHHQSTQDCLIPPCPTASIPGPWVFPMIAWVDPNGFPCAMVDSCVFFPDRNDENAWFAFIMENFERHYFSNKAPFGFYVHEGYIRTNPAIQNAFSRFLDTVNNLPDVFVVSAAEIIEWVRNPVPVNEYRSRPCRSLLPSFCPPRTCGPIVGGHNNLDYWMQICNACPVTYPWVGNHLGQ